VLFRSWFFGAGLLRALAPDRTERWLGHAPDRGVTLAFAAAFAALALTQLLPVDPHDRFEEGAELALYLTVLLAARRARSEARRPALGAAPEVDDDRLGDPVVQGHAPPREDHEGVRDGEQRPESRGGPE
jgi:hypothetical protein